MVAGDVAVGIHPGCEGEYLVVGITLGVHRAARCPLGAVVATTHNDVGLLGGGTIHGVVEAPVVVLAQYPAGVAATEALEAHGGTSRGGTGIACA